MVSEEFEGLTLVADQDNVNTQNLCAIFKHPALGREKTWAEALDRIIGKAGSSDFIFVGPSTRAGCSQANEHCQQRNTVRLS
jgi:hypothetical protein